jgi:hypothetical protein
MHEPVSTYAYLLLSTGLLVVWLILYDVRPDLRRQALRISLGTMPLGLVAQAAVVSITTRQIERDQFDESVVIPSLGWASSSTRREAGETVTLRVWRAGQRLTVTASLEKHR